MRTPPSDTEHARPVVARARDAARGAVRTAVEMGLPPRWIGHRWARHETVAEHLARRPDTATERYRTVHPEAVASNPLPLGVSDRDELPADRGWWGYSFRDVPTRVSHETYVATIPRTTVVGYHDRSRGGDYYPALLSGDGRSIDLREITFRPGHGEVLRRSTRRRHLGAATWILERSYHNHSHWLTAHLPKILLLQQLGQLSDVLLPSDRPAVVDDSLAMVGLDPRAFPTVDLAEPLQVDELTVIGTDRFRPELIRLVQDAVGGPSPDPHRRVYVSRKKAARRRLVDEDEIWPVLADAGFEKVFMEDLSFREQVGLMRETAVLCGPHGAGLTNMVFCPPGAEVVEIADPGFPNPNFYALASAARHHYRLLPAESQGHVHPLEQDLRIGPALVGNWLSRTAS